MALPGPIRSGLWIVSDWHGVNNRTIDGRSFFMSAVLPGRLLSIFFIVVALLAVVRAQADAKRAGDVVLETVTATQLDGEAVEFERGTLYVPENRNDPQSRLIGVGFARFRAFEATDRGSPPTVHLPGGPGTSSLTGPGK